MKNLFLAATYTLEMFIRASSFFRVFICIVFLQASVLFSAFGSFRSSFSSFVCFSRERFECFLRYLNFNVLRI